jgi:hypothetical protein
LKIALGKRYKWLRACIALFASDLGLEGKLREAEIAEADVVADTAKIAYNINHNIVSVLEKPHL